MALRLAAVEYGTGEGGGAPAAILHGLFGSGRNWQSIAQRLAAHRRVVTLDLRNHGGSPWDDAMDYRAMAGDVVATLEALGLASFALVGHSMGGKAAMMAALLWPQLVERLVVVDIAPTPYAPHHLGYVQAMRGLDLAAIKRRGEADAALAAAVPDAAERGFLLQNLVFDPLPDPPPQAEEGRVGAIGARWRLNLAAIENAMPDLVGWAPLPAAAVYPGLALFVAGERSGYVRPEHEPTIRRLFPKAQIAFVPETGHWLHAERPQAFLDLVEPFLAAGR